ncbi:D-2-hydroxyacid dehydrogenase family protein [Brevibacterium linens]|uniref:Phosphoglycerate dehydrogenase n=1 Tax=Brevibacterium linens ATCC 9172 TaxID=1255617 RepID=A0A2H1HTV7_BRELN|nr:D-2-hydroxyacid dehydrogenase family protein [Brevibacterium linens]AZU01341.1 hydroxyacid dehydrogenase [Brevibacterium linens]KAB1949862.1 D-2-hydroxyacid dehydrogenase family protein [Brevibacterium linens ATCC 9172]SMX66342.1 Phosphoglycerate dehydrogenase [Brevibacterium linens ATCC 9172]
MRIVVLDDYQQVAADFADWSRLDSEVEFVHRPIVDDDDLVKVLTGAQVVVAMRERTAFTTGRLARLPDLRLLVTTGRVNASIDVEAAHPQGIVVCGTESTTSATPELTWGLILSVLRSIPAEDASVRSGGWQTSVGGDLDGHRLGVVGLGRLGTKVARVGAAFGMDVVAWSQNLDAERADALGVRAVSKDELFSTADVVTIHYKLSDRSRGLVGTAELETMKPGSVLVNTSRAGLVDTDALIAVLEAGGIRGAGLDVHDEEPLPVDHRLRSTPRTVLTPHLGYVTEDTYRIFFTQAVEDIAAWIAGESIRVLG